jgi:predicted kinase
VPEAKLTAVETLQWNVAARAPALAVDVILENGFWSRPDRDEYRSRAIALGVRVQICFLDVPRDASLDRRRSWFEAPAPDELE